MAMVVAKGREMEVYAAKDVPKGGKRSAKILPFRDFDCRPEELANMVERTVGEKGSVDILEQEYNGVMGLAAKLRVDPGQGLTSEHELLSRRLHFGENVAHERLSPAAQARSFPPPAQSQPYIIAVGGGFCY